MMIFQLFDNVVADVEIEGLTIGPEDLISIQILERVGGALPILELKLVALGYASYSVIKDMPEINLAVGTDVDSLEYSTYKIRDFNYQSQILTLSCLLHLPDHLDYSTQWSEEGTLSEVLDNMRTVFPDVKAITEDKQIWIKSGAMSNWLFTIDSVMHSHVEGDDNILLLAYTSNGVMKVNTLHNILADEEHYIAKPGEDKIEERTIFLQDWMLVTNRASWDATLVNKTLPVFNVIGREVKSYGEGSPFPQLMNCGNTHEKYDEAYQKFIKVATKLSYDVIAADFRGRLSNSAASVMSKVELSLPHEELSGDYIVLEKSSYYSPSETHTRLHMGRYDDSDN